MSRDINSLFIKLNRFKNKYYTFKFVKGILLTFLFLLLLFTLFSVVEYFIYLPADVRKFLFFGFIIFACLLIIQLLLLPLLRMVDIIKPIDTRTSSKIIQKHFSNIKDKLLNVIELSEIGSSSASKELVLASIDQKMNEIQIFDFRDAVKFKDLKPVFFSFIGSLVITGIVYGFNQSVFTTAPKRIIDYNTNYIKPAPYSFKILNKDLGVLKGEEYTIKMEAEGTEIPLVAYINIDGNNYLMKRIDGGKFEFEMASVINPVNFYFTDLKYKSDFYKLSVIPKPGINNFEVIISPPQYTNMPVQKIENMGDIQIPAGSEIFWNFNGIDIDSLYFILSDSTVVGSNEVNNNFHVKHTFLKSKEYHVYIKNSSTEPVLALSYNIDVIPDLFPDINISRVQDSVTLTRFYFKGTIGDDYGFSNLKFHYNYNNVDSAFNLPITKNLNDQDFYFSFDFDDLKLKSGSISYYFSVSDNDAINGYKTTTSDHYIFTMPNAIEVVENEKERFENLDNLIKESENLAKEIQSDLQDLRFKNMDPNISEWEKTQMVNEILSKQNKLEQVYEQIKRDNEQLNNYMNSFSEQNETIIEKQRQIEELLDEVFTDELKNLLKKFQQLSEEFDRSKINELTEKLDYTYNDLQKQLERNLEMLRKMKVEQNLQHVIEEMKRLAAEEEEMAEYMDRGTNTDSVIQNIDNHKQELENLQKQLNDALDLNKELERQLNYDDFDEEFKDIQNSLEKSKDAIDKNNSKNAREQIKESSDQMKDTAMAMQQMLDANDEEQNMENINNLKQILSNLIYLSFEQENILNQLSEMHSIDPSLYDLNRIQKRIKDQSQIVKDSLYALAKRTPQINSIVNNELMNMELNLEKAISEMEEGLFPNARSSQQFVMTAANNLALLLNEALENLEQQMANAQPGNEGDKNTQNGKASLNLLKKQSENIKEQLQKMIDELKQGGGSNRSQQYGQSLMQHEIMQKMLREIMNSGGLDDDTKKALQEVDEILEQNRQNLMNKNIDTQIIARQNLINTRLLEAEKAEMEREYEERREGKTADDFYSNPVQFFEYEEEENVIIENLNKNSHKLSNFYINKYKQFLNNMQLLSDE